METLQSKTIKYNDYYIRLSNELTSSVKHPHSTRIEFLFKEKTITKWVGGYLDLDIIDTFANPFEYFQSIKDEIKDTYLELEMDYKNKKFKELYN